MEFVDVMKGIMDRLCISQRKLAELMAMSNQTIHFYINKKNAVPESRKSVIAYVLTKEIDTRIDGCHDRIKQINRQIDDLEHMKFELGEWL